MNTSKSKNKKSRSSLSDIKLTSKEDHNLNEKKKKKKNNVGAGILSKTALSSTSRIKYILISVLAITLLVYLRVFLNELTNRDDDRYILTNPYINSLSISNIHAIFTSFYMGNYHPLSMSCFNLGYQMGGINAWPYQLINLSFHLCNIVLVYYFITAILKRKNIEPKQRELISIITAALFAIHTLHVESVAWVSENKNVLYTFFFLSSLIVYLRYIDSKRLKFYLIAFLLFLFSLLSKGMAVSLSVSLIAIDLYLGRKVLSKNVILEKIPFLVLALLFGIIAVIAQGTTVSTTNGAGEFSLIKAISFGSYGFIQYVLKLIFPYHLSGFYEYLFNVNGPMPKIFYLYLVVAVIGITVLIFILKKSTFYLFGFLFYSINIFPVLQILPVGDAIMADRYAYVPSIGFFFIFAFGFNSLVEKFYMRRNLLYILLFMYFTALAFMTFNRIGVWENSISFESDVLKKANYSKYSRVWLIRGALYNKEGRYQEALNDLNMRIIGHPLEPSALFERAYAKSFLNDKIGAIEDYDIAVRFDSVNAQIYNNRGILKNEQGFYIDAIEDFNMAIAISDTSVDAYHGRADARIFLSDFSGALFDLTKSLEIKPANPDVLNNRGVVKINLGDYRGAIEDFNIAIGLRDFYLEAYQNRVDAKLKLFDYEGAVSDLDIILKFNKIPMAYYYRGYSKMNLGLKQEACEDIQQAVTLGYNLIDEEVIRYCGL